MNYLFWYLSIGVVVLLVVLILPWLSVGPRLPKSNFRLAVINGVIRFVNQTWTDILQDVIVIPVAVIFIIVAWPVAIIMQVMDILSAYKEKAEEEKKKFSISKVNLMRPMTVEEIEQQERVTDPMGAVPDLPFGHLNTAWSQFKNNLMHQDSIWAFSVQWTNEWRRIEIHEGYVIVRADNIGPHFLKSLRKLGEGKTHVQESGVEAPILDIPAFLTKQ